MYLPLGLCLLVNDRVVVLEVGTQSLGLEGGPDGVLVHTAGLRGPGWETVSVDGELVLVVLDNSAVFKEEELVGLAFNA